MKKKIILLITLLILAGFVVGVSAQEKELPDPGLCPDSPFYFLERIVEGIGTFFTFGDLKKAERYVTLAAERFTEAQIMAEKENPKLVVKTLKRYESQLVKALLRIERAKIKGKNMENITKVMTETTQRHRVVLERILEKVPEEAKPAIRHAIIMSTKEGLEMVAEAASDQPSGSLRTECMENGGPSEICEKIPLKGFESFATLQAFCTEAGGPPEICESFEVQCLEFGVTTANECFRALSAVTTKTPLTIAPPSEENMGELRIQREAQEKRRIQMEAE